MVVVGVVIAAIVVVVTGVIVAGKKDSFLGQRVVHQVDCPLVLFSVGAKEAWEQDAAPTVFLAI